MWSGVASLDATLHHDAAGMNRGRAAVRRQGNKPAGLAIAARLRHQRRRAPLALPRKGRLWTALDGRRLKNEPVAEGPIEGRNHSSLSGHSNEGCGRGMCLGRRSGSVVSTSLTHLPGVRHVHSHPPRGHRRQFSFAAPRRWSPEPPWASRAAAAHEPAIPLPARSVTSSYAEPIHALGGIPLAVHLAGPEESTPLPRF